MFLRVNDARRASGCGSPLSERTELPPQAACLTVHAMLAEFGTRRWRDRAYRKSFAQVSYVQPPPRLARCQWAMVATVLADKGRGWPPGSAPHRFQCLRRGGRRRKFSRRFQPGGLACGFLTGLSTVLITENRWVMLSQQCPPSFSRYYADNKISIYRYRSNVGLKCVTRYLGVPSADPGEEPAPTAGGHPATGKRRMRRIENRGETSESTTRLSAESTARFVTKPTGSRDEDAPGSNHSAISS